MFFVGSESRKERKFWFSDLGVSLEATSLIVYILFVPHAVETNPARPAKQHVTEIVTTICIALASQSALSEHHVQCPR